MCVCMYARTNVCTFVGKVRAYVRTYLYVCVYSAYNTILKKISLIVPRILQNFL